MYKKNITIDTEFFDDGIDAKFKALHNDQILTNSGQKSEEITEQFQRKSYENIIPNPRYQYVPDNEYSTTYEVYDMPPQSIKKLQSANNFQNIISRAMANLFVRCWEEMKALLPQYSHLVDVAQTHHKKINQQVLEDYNSVFNNQPEEVAQQYQPQKMNAFSKKNDYLDSRKNEIIQRQKQGLTLDSLSRQKLNRSKQSKKQKIINKTELNGQNHLEAQSGKNYREKFMEYKHRSKSRDLGMQKSLTYTKFTTNLPYQKHHNLGSSNNYSTFNYSRDDFRGVHSVPNIAPNKSQILRNINDILLDREEVYQGQKYNYYLNHRDSSRNMFSYQNQPYPTRIHSNVKVNFNPSTNFESYQNQNQQAIRVKLIQEIVQKLNFSKLRLQEIQKPKDQEQQILKRIDKLQKIILEFKQQEKRQQKRPQQSHQVVYHKIQDSNKTNTQNLEIYKKFIDEISSIRSEIRDIKNIKRYQPQTQPQQIVVKNDNLSSHIISEQNKLLSSYQQEFQRLMQQREKATILKEKQPQVVVETAKKSIFDQLIQNGKNSQKKVTWDEGWQANQNQTRKLYQNTIIEQSQTNNQTIRKSRRTQHLNKDDGFQKYRYTRNQVLENIGLKSQIQEEQRLWREEQARMQLDREKRDEQVRMMVENVRKQRNNEMFVQDIIDKSQITREKCEQQWENYYRKNYDLKQNSTPYCSFFSC